MKMKTVYCLRIRYDDNAGWSEPGYYRTRKRRDEVERVNRCMGGIRTHRYEEKKPSDEIDALVTE